MRFILLFLCWVGAATGIGAMLPAGPARAVPSDSADTRAPLIEFDESPEALIVRYGEAGGELGAAGGVGTLEVYGDGRVVIDNPHYMRRAGRHTLRLRPQELRRLLRSLARRGVIDFDAGSARRAITRKAGREARGGGRVQAAGHDESVLTARSDAGTTELELRLLRYRGEGETGDPRRDVRKRVRWRDVERDARRHPELESIQHLAAARREVRALMQHPNLRRSP